MKAYIIAVVIFFFIGYHVLPLSVYHSKLFFIVGLVVPYFITKLLRQSENQKAAHPVSTPPPPAPAERSAWPPHTADLLYPVSLPTMADLAGDDHRDPRALLYSIRYISPTGKRSFSSDALDACDFGGSKDARRFLIRGGLIREISVTRSLVELYSKDELQAFLRERGLPVKGNKEQLSDRLLSSGFQPEKKRRRKRYELTDAGRALIEEHATDRNAAIRSATLSIRQGDYDSAISAYRDYDSRWGFVHTSGKNHTIFANFDVPFSRFDFIAFYPMRELRNSADFKKSLRACLIAGLMRGEQERIELGFCFRDICSEEIVCPKIVDNYSMDAYGGGVGKIVKDAMQKNADEDSRYVLEYYIARVLYLSRQA